MFVTFATSYASIATYHNCNEHAVFPSQYECYDNQYPHDTTNHNGGNAEDLRRFERIHIFRLLDDRDDIRKS